VSDWLDDLSPSERTNWDRFVEHFRRDALEKIAGSAFTVSLVPGAGFDVKFATELGASIMLDKPILAIIVPGAAVPEKLRLVVDEVVEADLDVEEGREKISAAVASMLARISE
jgi:hypothetical protein